MFILPRGIQFYGIYSSAYIAINASCVHVLTVSSLRVHLVISVGSILGLLIVR